MAKILISGGSGLVGKTISNVLLKHGHEVRWLSRHSGNSGKISTFKWDVNKGSADSKAFEGIDHLIHLSGAGIIDKRWSAAYKKEIIDSRVKSTELLFQTCMKQNVKLKSLVGASATGYYGSDESEHLFTENDPAGNDFLANVCVAWEKSYEAFVRQGVRTAIIRTGIVLSKEGGAYAKMVPPFKFGFGAAIASGKQYFPWIHMKDLVEIYRYALFNEHLEGPYNAVTSASITNYKFSEQLAQSFGKAFFLPNVPEFVLKLALGERAVTVTKGVNVSNEKIRSAGFQFEFDDLKKALEDLKDPNRST